MIRRCLLRLRAHRTLMDAFLCGELRCTTSTTLPSAPIPTAPPSALANGATVTAALAAAEWTTKWCRSPVSKQVSSGVGTAQLVAMLRHVPAHPDLLSRVSEFILRQPNPAKLLDDLACSLRRHHEPHGVPGHVAKQLIDALRLHHESSWQIAGWCVVLEIITAHQGSAEEDGVLRVELTRGALAVMECHPSRAGAGRLLGCAARVCPVTEASLIDRIVAQVGTCLGGPWYTDADDLVCVVELAVNRPALDATVASWWRWLQHTRFTHSNRGLSAVLLALVRERHVPAATLVVQLLCSRGAVPSLKAQVAFLELLAAVERPSVRSAEMLAHSWNASSIEPAEDRGLLLCSLAKLGRKLQEPRVIADAYRGLMECHDGQFADLDSRLDLLQAAVNGSESPSEEWMSLWSCDPLTVLQSTVRWCLPVDDRLVALVVRLAHRLRCTATAAEWLLGSTIESFEASLQRVLVTAGVDGVDAVRSLCAAADRPVPDALAAWIQLLGDSGSPPSDTETKERQPASR